MTSIDIYDPKAADAALAGLRPLRIGSLVAVTVELLEEAPGLAPAAAHHHL